MSELGIIIIIPIYDEEIETQSDLVIWNLVR